MLVDQILWQPSADSLKSEKRVVGVCLHKSFFFSWWCRRLENGTMRKYWDDVENIELFFCVRFFGSLSAFMYLACFYSFVSFLLWTMCLLWCWNLFSFFCWNVLCCLDSYLMGMGIQFHLRFSSYLLADDECCSLTKARYNTENPEYKVRKIFANWKLWNGKQHERKNMV